MAMPKRRHKWSAKSHRKTTGGRVSLKIVLSQATVERRRAALWMQQCEDRRTLEEVFQPERCAYEKGFEAALWDVIVLCQEADAPMPEWTRLALIERGKQILERLPYQKHGRSARLGEKQRQLAADAFAYRSVRKKRKGGTPEKVAVAETGAIMKLKNNSVRAAVRRHDARLKQRLKSKSGAADGDGVYLSLYLPTKPLK